MFLVRATFRMLGAANICYSKNSKLVKNGLITLEDSYRKYATLVHKVISANLLQH